MRKRVLVWLGVILAACGSGASEPPEMAVVHGPFGADGGPVAEDVSMPGLETPDVQVDDSAVEAADAGAPDGGPATDGSPHTEADMQASLTDVEAGSGADTSAGTADVAAGSGADPAAETADVETGTGEDAAAGMTDAEAGSGADTSAGTADLETGTGEDAAAGTTDAVVSPDAGSGEPPSGDTASQDGDAIAEFDTDGVPGPDVVDEDAIEPDVDAETDTAGPGCVVDSDCDDGVSCTDDRCSGGICVQAATADCVCEGVPVAVGWQRTVELEGASVACPLVGGSAGFGTSLAVSGQVTPAHCANECETSVALTGSLTATVSLCSDTLSLTGSGTYSGTSAQCKTCDEETCRKTCTGGTCDTNTFGGNASLTWTRFYGYQVAKKSGPVEATFKCGASLSGTPSVGLSGTKTDDHGFACPGGSCTQCLSAQGQLGFGVQGAVDCFVSLDLWDGFFGTSLGCQGCGTIGVSAYGGVGGQRGECGGSLCASAGAGISASASTPCVGFRVGWYGISARCALSASACAEANNCGSCQCRNCADASTSLSCSVSTSGTCE